MEKNEIIENSRIATIFTDSTKCTEFGNVLIFKNLEEGEKSILGRRYKICNHNENFCYIVFGDTEVSSTEIEQIIKKLF